MTKTPRGLFVAPKLSDAAVFDFCNWLK
jgi:hypothetical protein